MTRKVWLLSAMLLGCAHDPAPVSVVIPEPPPVATSVPPATPRAEGPARSARVAACAPADVFQEAEMWKAIPPHDLHGPLEVLVWERIEDQRPWAVDAAVVWFRWKDHGRETHKLVSIYRNPHLPGPEGRAWHISMVYDVESFRSAADFDHRPTSAEVRAFLRDTMWASDRSGWTVLGSGVCSETWQRLTGEAPPSLP